MRLSTILPLLAQSLIGSAAPAESSKKDPSPSGGPPSDPNSWHQYVRAPPTGIISPVAVLRQYTTGEVIYPNALLNGTNGTNTVLIRNGPRDPKPSIVLDFGQNYVGYVNIQFAGSALAPGANDTGARPGISLAFSETLENLTDRSDFTRSDNAPGPPGGVKLTNGTDQHAVLNQSYTWTCEQGCQFGAQVCADGLHGFRYLRIILQGLQEDAPYTTSYGAVSIAGVTLTYSGYLGTPDTFAGFFECSDRDITQWWYDAVYTNDMCTDTFRSTDAEPRYAASPSLLGKLVLLDGAKRDRDPYVGDVAVSGLTLYMSHEAPQAVRNVLADLGDHQRSDGWIPPASINNYNLQLFDYPMWWIVGSSNLILYTGELDYLDTYYDKIVMTLDTFYAATTDPNTGLLKKGLFGTQGYGDYAFLPRTGIITYYNALYYLALNRAADLADIYGKPDDAARWRSRAAVVGPSLLAKNWDHRVGAFFDGGVCPQSTNNATCNVHAQDGNGLAILSGATGNDTEINESILRYMARALARPWGNAFYDSSILSPADEFDQRVYGFISYFEIAARFMVKSAVPSAYEEMRRLYGWMANHDPFSTFWEGIGPGGGLYEGGFTSMAHGWATGIVPLMMNYVLGVQPTGPGFITWTVNPVVSGGQLSWARGAVPTPRGPLSVVWAMAANGSLSLQVTPPPGTNGTVGIPVMEKMTSVKQDGQMLWSKGDTKVEGVGHVNDRIVVQVEGNGKTIVFETA